MKTFAVARLRLSDDTVLRNQVLEFDDHGNLLRHYPLTEELPFMVWKNEEFAVRGEYNEKLI